MRPWRSIHCSPKPPRPLPQTIYASFRRMRLTERILSFTLLGSEWVLWLLIGLSVLSVAVMVERAFFLSSGGTFDFEAIGKELLRYLRDGDVAGARRALAKARGPESKVATAGLAQVGRGSDAISEAM